MRARVLLTTALLTVVCLLTGANTAAAAFYYGPFRFVSTLQQRCLTVPAGSTAPGQRLILWDCSGGADQLWTLWDNEGPAWHIRNQHTGQCLAVEEVRNNGSWLVQRQCSQSPDQFWAVPGWIAGSQGAFRNYQSGQFMSLGSGSGNGTPVVQNYGCGCRDQDWRYS